VRPLFRLQELPPTWKVAVTILTNSRGPPKKGALPALGLGEVLTTPRNKHVSWLEHFTKKPRT